jgi:hypothetical protein
MSLYLSIHIFKKTKNDDFKSDINHMFDNLGYKILSVSDCTNDLMEDLYFSVLKDFSGTKFAAKQINEFILIVDQGADFLNRFRYDLLCKLTEEKFKYTMYFVEGGAVNLESTDVIINGKTLGNKTVDENRISEEYSDKQLFEIVKKEVFNNIYTDGYNIPFKNWAEISCEDILIKSKKGELFNKVPLTGKVLIDSLSNDKLIKNEEIKSLLEEIKGLIKQVEGKTKDELSFFDFG